jgi:hypothetical protein
MYLKLKTYIKLLLGLFLAILFFTDAFADNVKNIVFVGNSITLTEHSPDWNGSWGMAASSKDKDYVSQVQKLLSTKYKGVTWKSISYNINALERNPVNYKLDNNMVQHSKNAKIVIIELGDNFDQKNENAMYFSNIYFNTLLALHPTNGILACVSTWWSSSDTDKIIKENCLEAGGIFINISNLYKYPKNIAKNEQIIQNPGVAVHPGDAGMKAIAETIFKSIVSTFPGSID